jgi:hypothetical protein
VEINITTGESFPSLTEEQEEKLNQVLSDIFGLKITHKEDNDEKENCSP